MTTASQQASGDAQLTIRELSAATLVGFSAFLNLYAPQPLLPLLSKVFNASKAEIGLTITATTMAVAILAPIVGTLADLVGRKRIIVTAMFGIAVPTFLSAHSVTLHELIVWRFLQGIFLPGITAVIIAYIAEEWAGMGVGKAISVYVSGTVLGGFTGRFLTGLVADHVGWREAFIVLALLNVICGILTWSWLPRSRRFVKVTNWRGSFEAIGQHLRNTRLIATFGVGFSILFSLLAAFTYVTFYLHDPPFNLGTVALGSIFGVYLLGVVMTPISGIWIDRFGTRASIVAAMAFSSTGILLTLIHNVYFVIIGLAICSSGIFMAQSCTNSFIGEAANRSRASATGLYLACYYVGGSAGAVVPARFWAIGGWPACVLLIVAVQSVASALALAFWKHRPEDSRTRSLTDEAFDQGIS